MRYRTLDIMRCPLCKAPLCVWPLEMAQLPPNPQISDESRVCERDCPWGQAEPENRYRCRQCFSNDIHTGIVQCHRDHLFPIVNGIPRFLPDAMEQALPVLKTGFDKLPRHVMNLISNVRKTRDNAFERYFRRTQRSFSSEWSAVGESQGAWGLDPRARKKMFMTCFEIDESYLKGKKVLDAGCGHGEVELALLKTGAEIFASDLSLSVDGMQERVRRAQPHYASMVHVDQSNVFQLPFDDGRFDLVHSAGVLHHTPDTRRAFEMITSRVRKGGKCYIEVYSAELKNPKAHAVSNRLRTLTVHLPHPVLHALCYGGACLLWLLTRLRSMKHPVFFDSTSGKTIYREISLAQLELGLFDNFSPQYQHHHTTPEVRDWYTSLGYVNVKKTFVNRSGFGMVGTVGSDDPALRLQRLIRTK